MRCDHDDDDHDNDHDHNYGDHCDHNDDGDDQKSKMLPFFFGTRRYYTLLSARSRKSIKMMIINYHNFDYTY